MLKFLTRNFLAQLLLSRSGSDIPDAFALILFAVQSLSSPADWLSPDTRKFGEAHKISNF